MYKQKLDLWIILMYRHAMYIYLSFRFTVTVLVVVPRNAYISGTDYCSISRMS